jgi:hypothetical protein
VPSTVLRLCGKLDLKHDLCFHTPSAMLFLLGRCFLMLSTVLFFFGCCFHVPSTVFELERISKFIGKHAELISLIKSTQMLLIASSSDDECNIMLLSERVLLMSDETRT